MPSWSSLLLPRSKSTKSSSSSSASSSSSTSTPLVTPTSSSIWVSSTGGLGNTPKPKSRRRFRRKRTVVDAQPRPVQPRLTSLFFPTSTLTAEQEEQCAYKANFAASCSDLLGRRGRPVSGLWGEFLGRKQADSSSLDLSNGTTSCSTPYSTTPHSYSVGNLDVYVNTSTYVEETDPYLALAPRYPTNRRVQRKSVDYTAMMARMERSLSTSGAEGIDRMELWSSPLDSDSDLLSAHRMMPPPPVPARSALRPSASVSNLRDRHHRSGSNTPFTLDVDPIAHASSSVLTPPLPKAGKLPQSPVTPLTSSPSTESAFSIGRRRRPQIGVRDGSISGDPNRVRDGATSRESSSGVYTRVQGLQAKATASQSKVYTPSSFALSSPSLVRSFAPAPPSPSRSTSVSSTSTASSSGEVTTPRTPHTPNTPSSRFLGAVSGGWGSAVTGIKRASGALSTRSLSSPSATPTYSYTPTSARESYFPSTIHEAGSAQTASAAGTPLAPSLWPSTPGTASTAGSKPYGLGLGVVGSEDMSRRSRSESSATLSGEKFGGVLVGDVPKGKRKPVPKRVGSEEIKEEEETEVAVVHAM